jgi:two-component system sensor histidine kinase/response regulator
MKPQILIVDDRPENLFVLERLLQKLDVHFFRATSGQEALGLTLEHDFCVAIVDVQMPEMDGYELVDLMRGNEKTATLPVIFVSAIYSDEYHHRRAYDAGAVDFMSKPFIPEILVSKVKVFIDLYKQRNNLQSLVEKLDSAYLQLGIVNRELEHFAHLISSELKAPLRAINGYSRILIEDYLENLPSDAQECIHKMNSSAQRMEYMIIELLKFVDLGILPLQHRRVVMKEVAHDALDELLAQEPGRVVQVRLGELPDTEADPTLVRQVFAILLSNALKFSRQQAEAKIDVDFQQQDGRIVFFVRDNGVGFDIHHADKLFEVFQRMHFADEFEGVGLGLASARRIINRHGGQIWAEAEVNQGATFYFTLPETGVGEAQ